MLKVMAPDKAGDEGWSVTVTVDAWERAQMSEGSAAPGYTELILPTTRTSR